MIQHNLPIAGMSAHRIIFRSCHISHAGTDKTDNDVVGSYIKGIITETDSIAGSCLTGNSHIAMLYF